jgi:hypothetical protein
VSFLETANLSATVGGATFRAGDWEDTQGQVSDTMVIQGKTPFSSDNAAVYYQPFSYVVRSSKSIEDWMLSVKNILHPAGFVIFSEINNETSPDKMNYAQVKATEDSEISTYSSITVDSIKASLNTSSANLTADIVFLETNPQ